MKFEINDKEQKNVEVIGLGFKCKKCGRIWGIKCDDYLYERVDDIPKERFVCMECFNKEVNKYNLV